MMSTMPQTINSSNLQTSPNIIVNHQQQISTQNEEPAHAGELHRVESAQKPTEGSDAHSAHGAHHAKNQAFKKLLT